jgi:hypothetical protein
MGSELIRRLQSLASQISKLFDKADLFEIRQISVGLLQPASADMRAAARVTEVGEVLRLRSG